MAQRHQVVLECDLDQGDDRRPAETVTFYNSRGQQHEIEVCEEHRADIEEVLAAVDSFTEHARRIGGRPTQAVPVRRSRGATASNGSDTPDPKAVRAWAEEQGIAVSPRGRISAEVTQQYLAAH